MSKRANKPSKPPRTRESSPEPNESNLDPSAAEYLPKHALLNHIASTVKDLVGETEDRRAEADERRMETVLEIVEEKAREREGTMTELLRELIESNRQTLEQARLTAEQAQVAERHRVELAEKQSAEQAERWKREREDRQRRETLKAIPSPPAMTAEQDLADYLDLFDDNMRSREIPRLAQAKHLLPLLNAKATIAISGLPADAKADIDRLKETLLSTVYDTTKYASKAFWQMTKKPGDTVRATAAKVHRMCKRFALTDSVEKILKKMSMEKLLQLFPAEVQAHCRDKEPQTLYETADMIAKYMSLQEVDEAAYNSEKPWTYKTRPEKHAKA